MGLVPVLKTLLKYKMKLKIIGECNLYLPEDEIFKIAMLGDMKIKILEMDMRSRFKTSFNYKLFERLFVENQGQALWVDGLLNEKLRATIFEAVVEILSVELTSEYNERWLEESDWKIATSLITQQEKYNSLKESSQFNYGGYNKWHSNKSKTLIWINVKNGLIKAARVLSSPEAAANQILAERLIVQQSEMDKKIEEIKEREKKFKTSDYEPYDPNDNSRDIRILEDILTSKK